jgi:hypothetical protein
LSRLDKAGQIGYVRLGKAGQGRADILVIKLKVRHDIAGQIG